MPLLFPPEVDVANRRTGVIAFTVHGLAQPAGSKRGFAFKRKFGGTGVAIADANPKSKGWKNFVSATAREHYQGPLLDGPLRVLFLFVRPRPKGHFGQKGLRGSAPKYPTSRPDVLKCARGIEDALTGIIWRDDAQIIEETIRKQFGESAYVEIVIERME